MAIALLSDIHGNLAALEAVLKDIKQRKDVDKMVCLGDIVGYGPYPVECLALVRKACKPRNVLLGNHDLDAASPGRDSMLDPVWRPNMDWTARQLNAVQRRWLRARPQQIFINGVIAAHGKPMSDEKANGNLSRIYEYSSVFDEREEANLCQVCDYVNELRGQGKRAHYAAFGHLHLPFIYAPAGPGGYWDWNDPGKKEYILSRGKGFLLVCVPSVGLPRDGDNRTGYAVIDRKNATLVRLEYDTERTIKALRDREVPGRDRIIKLVAFGKEH